MRRRNVLIGMALVALPLTFGLAPSIRWHSLNKRLVQRTMPWADAPPTLIALHPDLPAPATIAFKITGGPLALTTVTLVYADMKPEHVRLDRTYVAGSISDPFEPRGALLRVEVRSAAFDRGNRYLHLIGTDDLV